MRLTNVIRERVEAKILNERYKEREATNKRAQQSHALNVHQATYPKGLEDVGEWVPMGSYVYVKTPNRKKYQAVILLESAVFEKRGHQIVLAEDETFKALFDDIEKIEEQKIKDGAIIRAVLNSCTTTKQLIETAPELAKYLPDEGAPTGNALVDMATVQQFREMLS